MNQDWLKQIQPAAKERLEYFRNSLKITREIMKEPESERLMLITSVAINLSEQPIEFLCLGLATALMESIEK